MGGGDNRGKGKYPLPVFVCLGRKGLAGDEKLWHNNAHINTPYRSPGEEVSLKRGLIFSWICSKVKEILFVHIVSDFYHNFTFFPFFHTQLLRYFSLRVSLA